MLNRLRLLELFHGRKIYTSIYYTKKGEVMDEITRLKFESSGYEVIELSAPDPHFRTRFFIKLPATLGGGTLADYEYMFQVPRSLNDGDKIALNSQNQDIQTIPIEINQIDSRIEFYDNVYMGLDERGLPVDWIMVGLVILVASLFIMLLINFVRGWFAPCGIGGQIQEINDCWKLVIKPDCSARSFNSCLDADGDGIPEGGWGDDDWTKNVDFMELIKWAVIGAVVIGGVVVVASLLKSRGQAQYAQQFPGYGPPPPSFRESIASRLYKPRKPLEAKPSKAPPDADKAEYDISAYQ